MSAKGILKKGLYTSSVRTEQSNAATLGLSLLLLLASPKSAGKAMDTGMAHVRRVAWVAFQSSTTTCFLSWTHVASCFRTQCY